MTCSTPRSVDVCAAGGGPLVALVSDQRDWHARQMETAFVAKGMRFERIDLAKCGFDTTKASGLALQHLGSRLPHAVLVRTLADGSFEAITKRLGVLHALSALGIPVWNDARAIERCVDKSMTSFELARAGLPTPSTWTLESFDEARDLVQRESRRSPLVLKPLFGAQGKGLRLVRSPADLPPPDGVAGVYYLQRFETAEGEGFRDYRLFVVKSRVIAAMMRRSSTWITNVKQGGEPWSVGRDAQMERTRDGGGSRGRRDNCGRRHLGSRRRRPDRARGQQHARLERPAKGGRGQYRRSDRRRNDGGDCVPSCLRARALNGTVSAIGAAFVEACLAELDALKPGNVHRYASGHRMAAEDFVRSAEASAGHVAAHGAERRGPRARRCRRDARQSRPEH